MAEAAKVVIVTGAAGNVGRAVVERLTADGARVVAVDRHAPAAGTVGDLPLSGFELTDPEACLQVVARTIDRFGRLDGLAHTVGGFVYAPAAQSDAATFEAMFRLNLLTTVNMVLACLPPMRAQRGGSLVAIASGVALHASAGMAAYAAAKSGILRLVESFAEELKGDGVRLNAILPSIIDTPQNRAAMPQADTSAWVKPAEIASTIAFLLGADAAAVTGAGLSVPGRM